MWLDQVPPPSSPPPSSPPPSSPLPSFIVPDPPPKAPPGMQWFGDFVIGAIKYGGIVAVVVGFGICAIMMALGRRNRSEWAAQGMLGIPYVIGAALILVGASGIVTGLLVVAK